MNKKAASLFFLICLSFLLCSCATHQYPTLSKEKIRNIRTIAFSFHPQNDSLQVIDIGGIRDDIYNKSYGVGSLHGALGVFVAGVVAETAVQYKLKKALGGDKSSIATQISGTGAAQIISDAILQAFRSGIQNCDYTESTKILDYSDSIQKPADNIIVVEYIYGIGVSEKYPPQPSIAAIVTVYDPQNDTVIAKRKMYSDITPLYNPPLAVPSLEAYSENNADLFREDLSKAAKNIGTKIAEIYTIY